MNAVPKIPKTPATPDLGVLKELGHHIRLCVKSNEWTPEVRAKAEELNLQLASYQSFRQRFGGLRELRVKLDLDGLLFWNKDKIIATMRSISHHTDLMVDGDEWMPNVVEMAEKMGLPLPCFATARFHLGYLNEMRQHLPIKTDKQEKRYNELLEALNAYRAQFGTYPTRGVKGKNGWGPITARNLEESGMVLPSANAYIRQFGSIPDSRERASKLWNDEQVVPSV